jgi:hypothetical protein
MYISLSCEKNVQDIVVAGFGGVDTTQGHHLSPMRCFCYFLEETYSNESKVFRRR